MKSEDEIKKRCALYIQYRECEKIFLDEIFDDKEYSKIATCAKNIALYTEAIATMRWTLDQPVEN